jgi:hypothetical protein
MSEATTTTQTQANALANTEKKKLYVSFAPDGTAQFGTCRHCVVEEKGRGDDAQTPDVRESGLDFPRDALLQRLAAKGLRLRIVDQFVCP